MSKVRRNSHWPVCSSIRGNFSSRVFQVRSKLFFLARVFGVFSNFHTPLRTVARSLLRSFSPSIQKIQAASFRFVKPITLDDWVSYAMSAAAHYADHTLQRWTGSIILNTSPVPFARPSLVRRTLTMNTRARSTATFTTQPSLPSGAMDVTQQS